MSNIKSLSPYYKTIPWVSLRTGLTCTSYELKIFVWRGLKTSAPILSHFVITKNNVEDSTGSDAINISRLVSNFFDFAPQTTSGVTQLLNGGVNQAWVKTVVYYTTSDTTELTIPQELNIDIMVKGYGYGDDGASPQFPSNKVLIPVNDYNVDKDSGRFVVPIVLDEKGSNIAIVDDTFEITFQDILLDVLVNDNLGWQPTVITEASNTFPEYTLSLEDDLVKFNSLTLPTTTNLLLRSEEFDNGSWVVSDVGTTANDIVSPDNSTTADKVFELTTTSTHQLIQTYSATNGLKYTLFAFFKKAEKRYVGIGIKNGSTDGGVKVDLDNNTVTAYGDGSEPRIRVLPSGWVRIAFTFIQGSAGSDTIRIILYSDDGTTQSYLGASSKGVHVWGAQMLLGAIDDGDYIKTIGTAITTAAAANWFRRVGSYRIKDSIATAASGNITLYISKLLSTILAVDDIFNVNDTDTVNLLVGANDSLGTTPTDIITLVQAGITSGTLAISGNLQYLTFTPNGVVPATNETFTYTIEDDTPTSSTATGTLIVTADEGGGDDTSTKVLMETLGSNTGILSCAEALDIIRHHDGLGSTPTLADKIYTDSDLLLLFDGQSRYYNISDGRSLKINSIGVVVELHVCDAGIA